MKELKMGVVESRFADLIWQNEPMAMSELVRICEKELNWKRTTTYTVLKRLSQRGLFQNNNGTVVSLMAREEFYSMQSQQFVEDTFHGSLPAFLTAFTSGKKLTGEEVLEIRKLIDSYQED